MHSTTKHHSSHPSHKIQHHFNNITARALDIAIASVMLLGAAPVMLVIAILVKLDSPGPILYSQVRVGMNRRRKDRREGARASGSDRRAQQAFGKPFPIYKFRSMCVDSEKNGAVWCKVGDVRITRLGALLRQTHLDELPQLFNILNGDMSIVGPRPERPEFVNKLTEQIPHYQHRLHMKPGLTGLAQVRHRSDLDLRDVKKKVRYDLVYRKNVTLWTNIKIILATVPLTVGIPVEKTKQITRFRPLGRLVSGFGAFLFFFKD